MSHEDVKKIKAFDTPGLKLIGFKSLDTLKVYHNIKPSYFVYPDEAKVKGSS
jgi:ATP-dependent DNA helicase 2 subunit 1